jgi:AcrR family transcriptional regulator
LFVLRLASLLLGAVNLGLAAAHLVELRPKRAMSGREWLTTQQAYRDFGKVAAVALPGALGSTLATAVLAQARPATALLTVAGAACSAATIGIWARFNEPVNREIATWNTAALPDDWRERRDQWEFAHATSAGLHAISLSALLVAALRDGATTEHDC